MQQIELYKSRSYTACIKDAFNTCTHNLKTIFFHTWAYALCLAIITAACVVAATKTLTGETSTVAAVGLLVSFVLLIVASVAMFGRATVLVNGQKTGWNIKRAARIMLVVIVFSLVLSVLLGVVAALITASQGAAKSPAVGLAVSAGMDVVMLIVYLLLLPYLYVFSKYMIEPETKLRGLLFKSYRTGLRHWGFIFTTEFLAWLCMTICSVVIALPAVIVLAALAMSINGVNTFGDPTGLPSYFDAMQFGWFALATFIWAYISIFSMMVCYFIYGSIETREKEKKEYLDRQQEKENA